MYVNQTGCNANEGSSSVKVMGLSDFIVRSKFLFVSSFGLEEGPRGKHHKQGPAKLTKFWSYKLSQFNVMAAYGCHLLVRWRFSP
jgi:hypothetical protein